MASEASAVIEARSVESAVGIGEADERMARAVGLAARLSAAPGDARLARRALESARAAAEVDPVGFEEHALPAIRGALGASGAAPALEVEAEADRGGVERALAEVEEFSHLFPGATARLSIAGGPGAAGGTSGPELVQLIAFDERARALTSLELEGVDLSGPAGESAAMALAASPHTANLSRVRVAGARISPEAASQLLDPESAARLTALELPDNGLGDQGASRLASLLETHGAPSLVRLDLSGNGIGAPGATELAESARIGQLASLDVSRNPIGRSALARLASSGPEVAARDTGDQSARERAGGERVATRPSAPTPDEAASLIAASLAAATAVALSQESALRDLGYVVEHSARRNERGGVDVQASAVRQPGEGEERTPGMAGKAFATVRLEIGRGKEDPVSLVALFDPDQLPPGERALLEHSEPHASIAHRALAQLREDLGLRAAALSAGSRGSRALLERPDSGRGAPEGATAVERELEMRSRANVEAGLWREITELGPHKPGVLEGRFVGASEVRLSQRGEPFSEVRLELDSGGARTFTAIGAAARAFERAAPGQAFSALTGGQARSSRTLTRATALAPERALGLAEPERVTAVSEIKTARSGDAYVRVKTERDGGHAKTYLAFGEPALELKASLEPGQTARFVTSPGARSADGVVVAHDGGPPGGALDGPDAAEGAQRARYAAALAHALEASVREATGAHRDDAGGVSVRQSVREHRGGFAIEAVATESGAAFLGVELRVPAPGEGAKTLVARVDPRQPGGQADGLADRAALDALERVRLASGLTGVALQDSGSLPSIGAYLVPGGPRVAPRAEQLISERLGAQDLDRALRDGPRAERTVTGAVSRSPVTRDGASYFVIRDGDGGLHPVRAEPKIAELAGKTARVELDATNHAVSAREHSRSKGRSR